MLPTEDIWYIRFLPPIIDLLIPVVKPNSFTHLSSTPWTNRQFSIQRGIVRSCIGTRGLLYLRLRRVPFVLSCCCLCGCRPRRVCITHWNQLHRLTVHHDVSGRGSLPDGRDHDDGLDNCRHVVLLCFNTGPNKGDEVEDTVLAGQKGNGKVGAARDVNTDSNAHTKDIRACSAANRLPTSG